MLWLRLYAWLQRPFVRGRMQGAALTEYALLIALIAVVVIAALGPFGEALKQKFTDFTTAITSQ